MTSPDMPHPAEPAEPQPRRYWWLTRLAVVWVLIVTAAAGVRVWWGSAAEGRLSAAIEAAHARGEKILIADYARLDVADAQNAAFYLDRAEKSLTLSRTEDWAVDNATALPLPAHMVPILEAALEKSAAALSDIRTARELTNSDWGVNMFSPMWSVLLPHLNPARHLAMLSRAAAIHAAHRGDHAAAIEHVRDIQAIGRSLDDGNTFLITHLVRIGIDVLAAELAAELARDLQIAGITDAATRPAHTPAAREQVVALIASLIDDGPRRASLHHALQGERATQVDIGMNMAKRARMVQPAIQLDMVGLTKEGEQLIAAAAAANVPMSKNLAPNPPTIEGPRVTAHVVSESIRPALGRALTVSQRATTQSRLAALALALRLYQLDHGGLRPPTLDALVPDYLPVLPLDPYAANGQRLRYIADPVAPYVYSVGDDGKDDSAAEPPWRPDAKTVDPLKSPDLFLRLTRFNAPLQEIDDMPEVESELAPTTGAAPATAPSG